MTTSVHDILHQNKESILANWRSVVRERYGQAALVELTDETRVLSPMSYTLSVFAFELVESLFGSHASSMERIPTEDFCKVQAVQNLKPEEALAIIFDLKNVIYTVFENTTLSAGQLSDLRLIEREIDRLALRAFSDYTEQKVRIVQIKNNEHNRLNRSNR